MLPPCPVRAYSERRPQRFSTEALLPARVQPEQVIDINAELGESGKRRLLLFPQGQHQLGLARGELKPGPCPQTPVHDQALAVLIQPAVSGHLIPVVASDVDPGERVTAPGLAFPSCKDVVQADEQGLGSWRRGDHETGEVAADLESVLLLDRLVLLYEFSAAWRFPDCVDAAAAGPSVLVPGKPHLA
jgi:hypothetical protein